VTDGVLIAEEELGVLSLGIRDNDRPADGAAKLVAVSVSLEAERNSGVEVAIAHELEGVAMETGATGLGG